ncbi:MAG TPA: Fur family transcriptional regulator [Dehalococcoidia bacterium]|nr:Fur family transcriptional regulator [Dehalococcoidia bacterium]
MHQQNVIGALLQEQGFRVTPQRLLILQTVQESQGHLSADEIYAKVAETHPYLDISTVYRTLERFAALGLLHKTDLGEEHTHYEWAESPHQHAVCERCGNVDHFSDELLAPLWEALERQHSFQVGSAKMAVFGLCGTCREAGTASP